MLGDNVMVAPVFTEAGDVQFTLQGRWTHLWHNDELDGSRWHKQQHGFLSLPVYVRDNTLLAPATTIINVPITCGTKARHLHIFNLQDGHEAVCEVPAADGLVIFTLKAARTGNTITVTGAGEAKNWTWCLRNVVKVMVCKTVRRLKVRRGWW
ncbi:hypothetical protein ACNKHU_22785 [Shigella flexneri]